MTKVNRSIAIPANNMDNVQGEGLGLWMCVLSADSNVNIL